MPIDINLLRVDAGKWLTIETSLWSYQIRWKQLSDQSQSLGGDPEKVKASERARFRDETIVDQIIEIDNKWRKSKYIAHFLKITSNSEIRGWQPEKGTRYHL